LLFKVKVSVLFEDGIAHPVLGTMFPGRKQKDTLSAKRQDFNEPFT